MQWRELAKDANGRTAVLVFEHGDDVMPVLKDWCVEQGVTAAHFTAIGAFERVVVAWFDWQSKEYRQIRVDEQVEVLSLAGDVALNDGEPAIHAHIVVGRHDASTRGGHFVGGVVRPTLELVMQDSPAHLRKRHDPESGLALIAPEAGARPG
ncbi:MAG TPA: PPC domain-containing DNA-binding protein [Acidothermaceae bacterium]|nr:PPC domain-containing DNA-binding protein [Acidothermaceae bacterium]